MALLALLCALACRPSACALQPSDAAERGRVALQRVRAFAAQPRYGDCWSSRPFPECADGGDVKECTRDMDPVAFNAYTEFFTHAYSICHYLESERWQQRTHSTVLRLTESSAGVAEQLASTQRLAEDLVQAQSVALQSQEAILRNGEELKLTLHESTQGVKEVFEEIQESAREQQLAFSEIFSRVAFLQSFVMSESHTLSSLLYNTLGLCAAFLATSTKRTAGARLILFGLVAINIYLERVLYMAVLESTDPGYQQMERFDLLVGLLRRGVMLLGLLILVYVAVRFRDVTLESLEILTQLKESHSRLQLALQKTEYVRSTMQDVWLKKCAMRESLQVQQCTRRSEDKNGSCVVQELSAIVPHTSMLQGTSVLHDEPSHVDTWNRGSVILETPRKHSRSRSSGSKKRLSSALVYSVLADDLQISLN
ncbi:hypothetical protein Z043_111143 [Scleropages formosus]|uniref:Protein brambleberry-like n=1 Tax=Scleropages formosus TaxID=113540 RepID=A0A0P7U6V2_SCLFO|nr:hypothetical protein Z043_111143 [Scleropages formosus]